MKEHPASYTEERLLKECTISFGRGMGPGGQHRNKVSTAALIEHGPSGLYGQASERRHQAQNRHVALKRLRLKLARKVRRDVHPAKYRPSELWRQRRQGTKLPVNPNNQDYPALLAEAMDVIVARGFDVAGAAGVLGVSMSQLARLVRHDKAAFAMVNAGRQDKGLRALK